MDIRLQYLRSEGFDGLSSGRSGNSGGGGVVVVVVIIMLGLGKRCGIEVLLRASYTSQHYLLLDWTRAARRGIENVE